MDEQPNGSENNNPGEIKVSSEQQLTHSLSLERKLSSLFSFNLDENQFTQFDDNERSLGSMNMDEILASISSYEENKNVDSNNNETNLPSLMNEHDPTTGTSIETGQSLPRQKSVTLPTSRLPKTLDEIWSEIHKEEGKQEPQRVTAANGGNRETSSHNEPNLGEMTLEDFLIKVGAVGAPTGSASQHLQQSEHPPQPPPVAAVLTPGTPNYATSQHMQQSKHLSQPPPMAAALKSGTPNFATSQHMQQSKHLSQPPPMAAALKSGTPNYATSQHMQQSEHVSQPPPVAAAVTPGTPNYATSQHMQQSEHLSQPPPVGAALTPGTPNYGIPPVIRPEFHHLKSIGSSIQDGMHLFRAYNRACGVAGEPSNINGNGNINGGSAYGVGVTFGGTIGNSSRGCTGYAAGVILPMPSHLNAEIADESPQQVRRRKRIINQEPAEVSAERRQRRMIKNRQSAAKSRARKQAQTVELDGEVNLLKAKNVHLKQDMAEGMRKRLKELVEEMKKKPQTRAEKTAEKLRSLRRVSSCLF